MDFSSWGQSVDAAVVEPHLLHVKLVLVLGESVHVTSKSKQDCQLSYPPRG